MVGKITDKSVTTHWFAEPPGALNIIVIPDHQHVKEGNNVFLFFSFHSELYKRVTGIEHCQDEIGFVRR